MPIVTPVEKCKQLRSSELQDAIEARQIVVIGNLFDQLYTEIKEKYKQDDKEELLADIKSAKQSVEK